ncbi:MAG: ABC transporter permease subunit [Actinobacteria bacterium]|nr:ABC transporter permease subunit [Actinomycetota bacterium]
MRSRRASAGAAPATPYGQHGRKRSNLPSAPDVPVATSAAGAERAAGAAASNPAQAVPGAGRARRLGGSIGFPLLSLLGLLVTWRVVVTVFTIPAFLLPTPEAVGQSMIENAATLLRHSRATLAEVTFGYLAAIAVGVPLGAIMASWRTVERLVYPPIVASQGIPKSALAPLFVIWFGFGIQSKIFIAMSIAFFPVVVTTLTGLKLVPGDMLNLGRTMGMNRLRLFWAIQLPHALPTMFSGFKVGITLAVVGAIVGEFVAADRGLGYLLIISISQFNTELVFAALVVLGGVGMLLYLAVMLAERLLIPWHVPDPESRAVSTM